VPVQPVRLKSVPRLPRPQRERRAHDLSIQPCAPGIGPRVVVGGQRGSAQKPHLDLPAVTDRRNPRRGQGHRRADLGRVRGPGSALIGNAQPVVTDLQCQTRGQSRRLPGIAGSSQPNATLHVCPVDIAQGVAQAVNRLSHHRALQTRRQRTPAGQIELNFARPGRHGDLHPGGRQRGPEHLVVTGHDLGRTDQHIADGRVVVRQDWQQLVPQPVAEKSRILVAAIEARAQVVLDAIGFDLSSRCREQGPDEPETWQGDKVARCPAPPTSCGACDKVTFLCSVTSLRSGPSLPLLSRHHLFIRFYPLPTQPVFP